MEFDSSNPIDAIDGRYQDLVLLAERGLASAYSAYDSTTGNRVFLKILRESKLTDPQAYQLFCREPDLIKTITSQRPQLEIPNVLTSGRWQQRPYFTQPFLNGWSLDKLIRHGRRLVPFSIIRLFEASLEFLSSLHDAGFVHGDISPDNIFIETEFPQPTDGLLPADFSVRILDYNSSQCINQQDLAPGQRRIVFLKLPYAAPELATGFPMSPASDLYALGVVLFELIVGVRPFHDPKTMESVRQLKEASVPPLPEELGVPRRIEKIVRTLLAREPGERYRTAHECLSELRDLRQMGEWISQTAETPQTHFRLSDSQSYFVCGSLPHSIPSPILSEVEPITIVSEVFAKGTEPSGDSGSKQTFGVLVIDELFYEKRRWVLQDTGRLAIGRSTDCEIRLVDSRVSRTSVVISREAGALGVLEVISEKNAPMIRINEKPLSLDTGTPMTIEENLSLRIFDYEFRIYYQQFVTPGFNLHVNDEIVSEEVSLAHEVPVPVYGLNAEQQIDLVEFSVFAPRTVAPSSSFVLEFWAYLLQYRDEVLTRAGQHGILVQRYSHGSVSPDGRTELTLIVRLDDFNLQENQDTIFWSGGVDYVAFLVRAPDGLKPGIYPGQISILHNGLLLTRLIFELRVGRRLQDHEDLNVHRQQLRSAFASYATIDRDEVLRRVQGIQATGMDVFVDVLSLRAGEHWEDELYKHIKSRDIFYLFWSNAARESEWVAREWRYALKERGLDFIHPIPLAPPDQVPPPAELSSKHFNDIILAVIKSHSVASSISSDYGPTRSNS